MAKKVKDADPAWKPIEELLEPYMWVAFFDVVPAYHPYPMTAYRISGMVKPTGAVRESAREIRRELLEQADSAVAAMINAGFKLVESPEIKFSGKVAFDLTDRWGEHPHEAMIMCEIELVVRLP